MMVWPTAHKGSSSRSSTTKNLSTTQVYKKNSIVLKKPPKFVEVELIDRTPGTYEDLLPNYVPIYPVKAPCVRAAWRSDGSKVQHKCQRGQLPLTPAFAF